MCNSAGVEVHFAFVQSERIAHEYCMITLFLIISLDCIKVFISLLSLNQQKNEDTHHQQTLSEKTDLEDENIAFQEPVEEQEKPVESRSCQLIRDELLTNVQKFLSHIERTVHQLEGLLPLRNMYNS